MHIDHMEAAMKDSGVKSLASPRGGSLSSDSYYAKFAGQQLRQLSRDSVAAAEQARAEDRNMLRTCFQQNSARMREVPRPPARAGRPALSRGSSQAGAAAASDMLAGWEAETNNSVASIVSYDYQPAGAAPGAALDGIGRPKTRPGGFHISKLIPH